MVVDFHSFRETHLLTKFSRAPIRIGLKDTISPYLSFCFNKPPIVEDKNLHVTEHVPESRRRRGYGESGMEGCLDKVRAFLTQNNSTRWSRAVAPKAKNPHTGALRRCSGS